ncbi:uncharacterized protein BYT42DRAFT_569236 [Radiomyces spectabilis]|uniref:uncharacterized protein n=1 Tax=Radiomyces spectabilis TaxID=64574 RepID=UPI0022212431|nr:uncharacterized protein BYT42DRAFT_569236 [Radiomyces spectabilis]KAI8379565.1 hypothetical protein BYT42DRAFT_569236 [Radiomyces spectabilis]
MADTLAPPTLPKGVKKPNKEEFDKQVNESIARIEKLKKQMNTIWDKINSMPAQKENARQEEVKAQLQELRRKQAEIKSSRKAVYEQLDALQESIRQKVNNIKSFQNKVPYKTKAEVDQRIAELESKIESGVRLVEEKKILQEISQLKRGRDAVEDVDEQQAAIDRERAIHAELKKNIDTEEAKKLSKQYEELDAEFKNLHLEQNKQWESRNKLFNELTKVRTEKDEEQAKLRTLRDEHRKANDEYYNFVRKLREFKEEQERLRKIQEEKEKREAAAKQELEEAALPAFESEIALCENLTKYLQGFVAGGSSEEQRTDNGANAPDAPEGMVVMKKKDDEEFFSGASKKKQRGNKANKEKKTDALKLPLATMEAFFDIKVTVPTKISEIPATLEKLKERKAYYVAEQPKVTEANKKRAEEKIAALQKKMQEEQEEAAAAAKATEEQPVSQDDSEKADEQ